MCDMLLISSRPISDDPPTFAGMKGDLQRIVGENLRAYRRAREISQEDFAYTLGVHRAYLSGVERGQRNLTLQTIEGMAAQLEIEPISLLEAAKDR